MLYSTRELTKETSNQYHNTQTTNIQDCSPPHMPNHKLHKHASIQIWGSISLWVMKCGHQQSNKGGYQTNETSITCYQTPTAQWACISDLNYIVVNVTLLQTTHMMSQTSSTLSCTPYKAIIHYSNIYQYKTEESSDEIRKWVSCIHVHVGVKNEEMQHTISFRRDALVGGVTIRRSPASLRALSRDVLSISRKRSISLGTGSIGIERVASNTWDAVLKEKVHYH